MDFGIPTVKISHSENEALMQADEFKIKLKGDQLEKQFFHYSFCFLNNISLSLRIGLWMFLLFSAIICIECELMNGIEKGDLCQC